jgi:DNA-binding response OmpR family regulator
VPEPSEPRAGPTPPGKGPDLTLVPARSAVLAGGGEVALTPTQFRLLSVLLEQPGRAFTRAELVGRGIGDRVTERTVDVHVKELRRRLGEWRSRVVAVRGVGYRYRAGAGEGGG